MSAAASPEPHRSNAGQGSPGPFDRTAPSPLPQRDMPSQGCRKDRGPSNRSLDLSSPSRNLDVRRRCFDPLIIGIVAGAIAAIVGLLLGMIYILQS